MTGNVFNIQRFSLHDGPGIRTTVFFTGCTLDCRWCHNPEGKIGDVRLQFDRRKCIGCRKCENVCLRGVHSFADPMVHDIDRGRCDLCGRCIKACPAQALAVSGSAYTAEEIARKAARDIPFYASDGGLTLSGGEPLMQADFAAECARLSLEAGVPGVAVDTAGNVPWSAFEKVLPYTQHFLFDIKAADEETHLKGTGSSNRLILENLSRLDGEKKNIYIRIPVIGNFNDNETEMKGIAGIIGRLKSVREVRLIPYHSLGMEKYAALGLEEPEYFGVPDEDRLEAFCRITGGVL